MILLQTPRITGTEAQQLSQIRDYLGALIPQLNMALAQANRVEQTTLATATPQAQRSQQEQAAAATFQEVKGLIIKSADIVNAYYDKISLKLEGMYVAQSEFGTYKEETALLLNASSQRIDLLFTNDQQIGESITWLESGVNDLGENVTDLTQRTNAVESGFGELETTVDGIRGDVDGFGEDIVKIQGDTEAVMAETEALRTETDELKADTEALKADTEDLEENTANLSTDLSTVQAATNDLRQTSGALTTDVETVKANAQATADTLDALQSATEANTKQGAALAAATDSMAQQLSGVVADNLLTKAYMRVGLLGTEDGLDVYGLEIGQNVAADGKEIFSKFMRLSSGKLRFYNGDGSLAAEASGDRFLCPVLEARKLYLGGFSFLPRTNGNLSVRWMG